MSPDELRQHLSHAVKCRLVLLAKDGKGLVREVAGPRGRLSTTPWARATKSIASPYTSSFSWSNGMRGIPSGSGSGAGSFTDDAKDGGPGLATHET
jgi:hypothetical protein